MVDQQIAWLREFPVGEHVVNRLRLAMLILGLDNQEVAKRTGLREQYVSGVSTGRIRNISVQNAHRFTLAFEGKVTLGDLFPVVGEEA